MSTPTTPLLFAPGPLGFELEPLWRAHGKEIGCRVAGFKDLDDGTAGQAERLGRTKAGDVLIEVDGISVRDIPFGEIIDLLQRNADYKSRHLVFQSSVASSTPTFRHSQDPFQTFPGTKRSCEVNTGVDTEPTTPSPARHPAPTRDMKEPDHGDDVGGASEPPLARLRWAVRFLGIGGHREGKGDENNTCEPGSATGFNDLEVSVVGEREKGKAGEGKRPECFHAAEGGGEGLISAGEQDALASKSSQGGDSRDQNGTRDEATADDDDGAQIILVVPERSSGIASPEAGIHSATRTGLERRVGHDPGQPLQSPAGKMPLLDGADEKGKNAASTRARQNPSPSHFGNGRGFVSSREVTAAPVDTPLGHSMDPWSRENEARALSEKIQVNLSPTRTLPATEAVTSPETSDVFRNGHITDVFEKDCPHADGTSPHEKDAGGIPPRSDNLWETAMNSMDGVGRLRGVPRPPQSSQEERTVRKIKAGNSSLPTPTALPLLPAPVIPEPREKGGALSLFGGDYLARVVGVPDAEDSLDTVSLRSDSVSAVIHNASSFKEQHQHQQQRHWIVPNIWGKGRGGNLGESSAVTSVATPRRDEDSEVEGARRLARSLAAKLKDRARRCEELEDLFGLRDEQVSMLQRQSNSLAERAASLEERLSDMTALADALQVDRTRLEEDLASRSHDAGQEMEDRRVERSDVSDVVKLPGGSVSDGKAPILPHDASDDDHHGDTSAASRALALAMEKAEAKASADIAAAEAHALALSEMTNCLLKEKVDWEEERSMRALEATRLRARVRGLEEAEDNGKGGGHGEGQGVLVGRLRELLKERTQELEMRTVETERLAASVRELEGEGRRLSISLAAREEDILVSDREMQALSTRLKGQVRQSEEKAVRAEAVAGALRKAMAEAVTGIRSDEDGNPDGGSGVLERCTNDSVKWAEERARLQHNLLSLTEALRDREARAEVDEKAAALLLTTARDDRDRFKSETVSLRSAADSLRVELAQVLRAEATNERKRTIDGGNSSASEMDGTVSSLTFQHLGTGSLQGGTRASDRENDDAGEQVPRIGGIPPEQEEDLSGGDHSSQRDVSEGVGNVRKGLAEGDDVSPASEAERGGETEGDSASRVVAVGSVEINDGGGSEDGNSNDDAIARASVIARDAPLNDGYDGETGDLQLDLMEKDIVIEQLRSEVQQLRLRVAVMEEEQAVAATPLQGLLTHLEELKGSVQEREEREQQCKDQVDFGLMRMERLKEENAAATAATVASPPVSFAGSMGVPQMVMRQVDSAHGQAEQQRLQRQIEDLEWEVRTLKRRIEERDLQLRDVRIEIESNQKRLRDTEGDLATARTSAAVAATEGAAERRSADARRDELRELRAELQSARRLADISAEEHRMRLESVSKDRVASVKKASSAAAGARDRAIVLETSLKAAVAERDALLVKAREAAARQVESSPLDTATARTRETETLKCALAARDVELEAILEATAGFSRQADSGICERTVRHGGHGGKALRSVLAAATEARRASRLVTEVKEEGQSLRAKVAEEKADVARLRVALNEATCAQEKAVAAAAAANAKSAAAQRQVAGVTQQMRKAKLPKQLTKTSSTIGTQTAVDVSALELRVSTAEDALRTALTGAEQTWRVLMSCRVDENRMDEDPLGLDAADAKSYSNAAASPTWEPVADPGLSALVTEAQTLAGAHRKRGQDVRRAAVTARAKTVYAREARRKEAVEARAREEAEGRLEEALAAMHTWQQQQEQQRQGDEQYHHHHHHHQNGAKESEAEYLPENRLEESSSLTPEQEEHLRQIRGEVDRLVGQNQTLRRSLVGEQATELPAFERHRNEDSGGVSTQRLLFSQRGSRSDDYEGDWECVAGTGGTEAVSVGTRSPDRSRMIASTNYPSGTSPWCHDDAARALAKENCAFYSAAAQDDGSGGTVVPVWQVEASD